MLAIYPQSVSIFGLNNIHTDHLGSSTVVTDSNENVINNTIYTPN